MHRRTNAGDGRGKFDKYTELWRDVERARENIYVAHTGWLGDLISRMTGRGEDSR
jgi:hypothetical protein